MLSFSTLSFQLAIEIRVLLLEPLSVGIEGRVEIDRRLFAPFVQVKSIIFVAMVRLETEAADMELAHERGLIARLLQPLREEDFVLRQNVIKSVDTVSHDAFAGQQAGAAGGADRTVHVAIFKYNSLLGNPVKI